MNKVLLNVISLNHSYLNLVTPIARKVRTGGGGGGDVPDVPDVPVGPDIPEGYEAFMAFDMPFLAADGDFYVKL